MYGIGSPGRGTNQRHAYFTARRPASTLKLSTASPLLLRPSVPSDETKPVGRPWANEQAEDWKKRVQDASSGGARPPIKLSLPGKAYGMEAAVALTTKIIRPMAAAIVHVDMGDIIGSLNEDEGNSVLELFSDALRDAPIVTATFDKIALNPDGVDAIMPVIDSQPPGTLRHLSFNDSGLNGEGVGKIVDRLISKDGRQHGACRAAHLRTLLLHKNEVGKEGNEKFTHLLKECNDLEVLQFSSNRMDPDEEPGAGSSLLAFSFQLNSSRLVNLTDINFYEASFGLKEARAMGKGLTNLPALIRLNLGRCRLGEEGIGPVCWGLRKSGARLEELDVSYNELKTAGAKTLSTLMAAQISLQVVIVDGNEMGCEGVGLVLEALASSFASLKTFSSAQNELMRAGARCIINALRNAPNLQRVLLDENSFSEESVEDLKGAFPGEVLGSLEENIPEDDDGDDFDLAGDDVSSFMSKVEARIEGREEAEGDLRRQERQIRGEMAKSDAEHEQKLDRLTNKKLKTINKLRAEHAIAVKKLEQILVKEEQKVERKTSDEIKRFEREYSDRKRLQEQELVDVGRGIEDVAAKLENDRITLDTLVNASSGRPLAVARGTGGATVPSTPPTAASANLGDRLCAATKTPSQASTSAAAQVGGTLTPTAGGPPAAGLQGHSIAIDQATSSGPPAASAGLQVVGIGDAEVGGAFSPAAGLQGVGIVGYVINQGVAYPIPSHSHSSQELGAPYFFPGGTWSQPGVPSSPGFQVARAAAAHPPVPRFTGDIKKVLGERFGQVVPLTKQSQVKPCMELTRNRKDNESLQNKILSELQELKKMGYGNSQQFLDLVRKKMEEGDPLWCRLHNFSQKPFDLKTGRKDQSLAELLMRYSIYIDLEMDVEEIPACDGDKKRKAKTDDEDVIDSSPKPKRQKTVRE